MNKKGQLGLEMVKGVILSLLILSVLVVAIMLVLPTLRNTTDTIDITSGTTVNESLTSVDEVGELFVYATQRLPACSVTQCVNATDGIVVPTANYTATSCRVKYSGVIGVFNNTNWKCTYSWTYTNAGTTNLVNNVTSATAGFFSNSSTIFAILAAVMIISAIAIIIAVVSRFGGNTTNL